MATKSTTGRSRSSGTRTAKTGTTTRRRATPAKAAAATSMAGEARTAIRSARTRAARAAKHVPTDTATLSIAAGVIAGVVAAGVAIFMNRDRLRSAAAHGGDKIRKAADDLSAIAHERIDQTRDNIARLRSRPTTALSDAESENIAING